MPSRAWASLRRARDQADGARRTPPVLPPPPAPPRRPRATEPAGEDDVSQVLMSTGHLRAYRRWLDENGLELSPPLLFREDDVPTYIVTPKD